MSTLPSAAIQRISNSLFRKNPGGAANWGRAKILGTVAEVCAVGSKEGLDYLFESAKNLIRNGSFNRVQRRWHYLDLSIHAGMAGMPEVAQDCLRESQNHRSQKQVFQLPLDLEMERVRRQFNLQTPETAEWENIIRMKTYSHPIHKIDLLVKCLASLVLQERFEEVAAIVDFLRSRLSAQNSNLTFYTRLDLSARASAALLKNPCGHDPVIEAARFFVDVACDIVAKHVLPQPTVLERSRFLLLAQMDLQLAIQNAKDQPEN